MTNYASGTKLSDLSLAGDPPPEAASAPVAAAPPATAAPPPPVAPVVRDASSRSSDEYLAQAIQEYEAGTIDQPLWLRALDLSGNNPEAAKPAYLRARAAALWVAKRNKQLEKPPRRRRESTKEQPLPRAERIRTRSRSRLLTLAVGGLGFIALVGGGLVIMLSSNDSPRSTAVDTKSPSSQLRAASKPAAAKAESERVGASGDELSKKVSDLKAANNWNVLVLYAVEWTRKAPANADAWNELGMGYAKLRQFSDALEAATKATQLAPNSPQAWQNLGEINVALQQPDRALLAYQQAVLLNERDVTSLVQVGLLNAQLDHLSEAKVAFAHVLEMNPLDVDALCGAGSIAQKEGRSKDADAITRQLKAADLRCRDTTVVVPVAVAAAAAAAPAAKNAPAGKNKAAPPARR